MVKKIFLFYVAIIVFGLLMFCQPTSSRDRCYASGCSANKYICGDFLMWNTGVKSAVYSVW